MSVCVRVCSSLNHPLLSLSLSLCVCAQLTWEAAREASFSFCSISAALSNAAPVTAENSKGEKNRDNNNNNNHAHM